MRTGNTYSGRDFFALLFCLLLGACTSQIDELSPSLKTVQILRERAIPSIALGEFTPGSKDTARNVSFRVSTLRPPKGQNFADFLRETFKAELTSAGKLDPSSAVRLEGVLTNSTLRENLFRGEAHLGITVTLRRSDKVVFTKAYQVQNQWRSDFIGALAIPEAFRQYNALYALLVREVLSDPEFATAAKRSAG